MNKIYWLTGQSGAGKTTLAKKIQEDGFDCIILDGDQMRDSISLGAGFSKKARKKHNLKIARLANIISIQKPVIVTVIAPMEDVRLEITNTCNPIWIYIKRTLPKKKNRFYEEPKNFLTLDHDKLNVFESTAELKKTIGIESFIYSLFIGRFQPLHKGHIKLIQKVIDEGRNVLIALRNTEINKHNPYSILERKNMFYKQFGKSVRLIVIPDIDEVCYGREVGWGIREIKLDEATENISGSKIREEVL